MVSTIVLGFHTMIDQQVKGNSLLLGCGPSKCVGTKLQITYLIFKEMTPYCVLANKKNSNGCQI